MFTGLDHGIVRRCTPMTNPNFSTCCGKVSAGEAGLLAFAPVEKLERLEVAAGGSTPPDAEDLEELVVEALGLGLLVRGVGPFTGEAVERQCIRRERIMGAAGDVEP